jgi:hypothetical protein
MRRAFLALALCFASLAASAAQWVNVDPTICANDNASQYRFDATDSTGFSSVRGLGPLGRTVSVGFADGAGGDATVYSCSDAACTESKVEATFTADGEAIFVPRFRRLRVQRVAVGAGTSILEFSCGSNVAVASAGGSVNASAIIDDLGCTGGQSIRRDAGDSAWECYTPGGGGGDNVSVQGVAAVDPDLENEGDADPIRCTGAGAPDARCVAAEDVIFEVRQADALESNGGNCGANQWAAGVDTAGAAEGCTADDDVPEAGDYGALSATAPITQSGGTISTSMSTARLLGRTTVGTGVAEEITVSAPLTLSAGTHGLTQNAGTDVTADLEEESHASEHHAGGADVLDDDSLPFDDADSNFTATALGPALEELDDTIGGGFPNQATGKVEWSQLVGVPIGFADNSDDGAGGGGDNVSVNGSAATDADFDDTTPAAASGGTNVVWQKDASTPNNVSAHVLPWNLAFTSFALAVVSDSPSASQNDYAPTGWNGTQPARAVTLRLTPTVTLQITGVTGGSSGRLLRIENATDPGGAGARLIILPHESSSSSAANRITFPHRAAWFLQPGDSITFSYDATTSRWRPLERVRLSNLFDSWSEFLGGATAELTNLVSGTGASCQVGTYLATSLTQNPVAALQCDSGTTATGRAAIALSASGTTGINPEESSAFHLARIAVEALATAGTEDYEVLSGFSDGGATQPLNTTDGVYWLYDVDASTAWRGCGEDAGVQDCATATGPTVDTNYIWLGIFLNGDWSRADFFYSTNGVDWTITTAITNDANLPEGAETTNWIPVVIVKEAGTTQRNVDIDFTGLSFSPIRGS